MIRARQRAFPTRRYKSVTTSAISEQLTMSIAFAGSVASTTVYPLDPLSRARIYAVPDSLADVVPYYKELDAAGRVQADSLVEFVQGVVAEAEVRTGRLPQ